MTECIDVLVLKDRMDHLLQLTIKAFSFFFFGGCCAPSSMLALFMQAIIKSAQPPPEVRMTIFCIFIYTRKLKLRGVTQLVNGRI